MMSEQSVSESDAQLIKEGAGLVVTGAQVEAARGEMDKELQTRSPEKGQGEKIEIEKATPAKFYGFAKREEASPEGEETEVIYFVLEDSGGRRMFRGKYDADSYTTGPRMYIDEATYSQGMEILKTPIEVLYLRSERVGDTDGFEGMVFAGKDGAVLGKIGTEYRYGGTESSVVTDIDSWRLGAKQ